MIRHDSWLICSLADLTLLCHDGHCCGPDDNYTCRIWNRRVTRSSLWPMALQETVDLVLQLLRDRNTTFSWACPATERRDWVNCSKCRQKDILIRLYVKASGESCIRPEIQHDCIHVVYIIVKVIKRSKSYKWECLFYMCHYGSWSPAVLWRNVQTLHKM